MFKQEMTIIVCSDNNDIKVDNEVMKESKLLTEMLNEYGDKERVHFPTIRPVYFKKIIQYVKERDKFIKDVAKVNYTIKNNELTLPDEFVEFINVVHYLDISSIQFVLNFRICTHFINASFEHGSDLKICTTYGNLNIQNTFAPCIQLQEKYKSIMSKLVTLNLVYRYCEQSLSDANNYTLNSIQKVKDFFIHSGFLLSRTTYNRLQYEYDEVFENNKFTTMIENYQNFITVQPFKETIPLEDCMWCGEIIVPNRVYLNPFFEAIVKKLELEFLHFIVKNYFGVRMLMSLPYYDEILIDKYPQGHSQEKKKMWIWIMDEVLQNSKSNSIVYSYIIPSFIYKYSKNDEIWFLYLKKFVTLSKNEFYSSAACTEALKYLCEQYDGECSVFIPCIKLLIKEGADVSYVSTNKHALTTIEILHDRYETNHKDEWFYDQCLKLLRQHGSPEPRSKRAKFNGNAVRRCKRCHKIKTF